MAPSEPIEPGARPAGDHPTSGHGAGGREPGGRPTAERRQISHELAVLAILGSVIGVETGAAFGKGLFAAVPPTTATWLRFSFAAAVLLGMRATATALRRTRRHPGQPKRPPTRSGMLAALAYAVALCGMNWSFYLGIATIPLGIAVTIEYLGPLAVAIIGSRSRVDLIWAGLAGIGVALLGFRPIPLDLRGVGFLLMAAACWAGYITFGARARRYWGGADLVTMACLFGSIMLAIPAITGAGSNLWTVKVLGMGLVVGVLSSVLPYTLDMVALGRVSPALFSILQSLAPAAAALAGLILLGEVLGLTDWLALFAVVTASAGATLAAQRRERRLADGTATGDNGR